MSIIFEAYTGASDSVGDLRATFKPIKSYLNADPAFGSTVLLGHLHPFSDSIEAGLALRESFPAFESGIYAGANGSANLIGRFQQPLFVAAQAPPAMTNMLFGVFKPMTFTGSRAYAKQTTTLSVVEELLGRITAHGVNAMLLHGPSLKATIRQALPNTGNFFTLVEQDLVQGTGDSTLINALRDAMSLSESQHVTAVHVILDTLLLTDKYTTLAQIMQSLTSKISLFDVVSAVVKLNIHSAMGVGDIARLHLNTILAIIDHLMMQDSMLALADVHQMLASILALRDANIGALSQKAHSTADVSDALTADITTYMRIFDQLRVHAVPGGTLLVTAFITDSMGIADTLSAQEQIMMALASGACFSVTLNTGQDVYTAWVMTPETKAMRSYTNFPFNSFAVLDGVLYGASTTGVYAMGGETDAGALIQTALRTGMLDFGSRQIKRIDRSYIGYTSAGTLCLRVVATEATGEKVEYTYAMVEMPANAPTQNRINISRGTKSVYWSFELINNGSEFTLYDMTILPMVLTGRYN